jgi:hypothetical protein
VVSDAAKALSDLNEALARLCGCKDLGTDEEMFCQWYGLSDMAYERFISKKGAAPTKKLPYLDL